MRTIVACALLAVGCHTAGGRSDRLMVATTTSVQNSGLLDVLMAAYDAATVRAHAVGSGLALQMLADGTVDLAISHAPETEAHYLAKHPNWQYWTFAYNRFVIVGPAADPANVRGLTNAIDAFRRIAQADVWFVSRGDGSGTHEREQRIWRMAGVTPARERLIVSGRGMALALRHANERGAYTLSDEPTFDQFASDFTLKLLADDDGHLLNSYAVLFPRQNSNAARFAEWLTQGKGKDAVGQFRVAGKHAFILWPTSCPNDRPDLQPCGARQSP